MKELFDFNKKCNEEYIYHTLETGIAHKKILDGISHILNLHYKWIAVINNEKFNPNLWQTISANDLFKANNLVFDKTIEVLKSKSLEDIVQVGNSHYSIGKILHHIIIHSTHHRAQINAVFNKFQKGAPSLEYIDFSKLALMDEF